MCFGEALDGVQDGVKFGAVEELAKEDYGVYFLGVVDVDEGIGVEEEKVGQLAWLDGALCLRFAEEFGGKFCCCLQGLHWGEARFDEKGELFVQAGTGENVRGRGVCAREDAHTCGAHFRDDPQ